jgi:Icc-related predicted phosphoesterase
MKLLCFADLHGDTQILKKILERSKEADLLIVAGDLTNFGDKLRYLLRKLDSCGKKVLLIHGNHEDPEILKKEAADFDNIEFFDKKAILIGDYVFLGYGEGGFSVQDQDFRKIARDWYGKYQKEKIVLVLHAPPYGTSVDKLDKRHAGNKDFRKFIERIKPKLVVCGHLHETAGKKDKIGETIVVNPGWDGAMVELD